MKIIAIILPFLISTVWASEEHREHAAHLHGHAEMNLALSGMELELEMESPAMNLVGFEHYPQSPEDSKKVNDAAVFLTKPANWIKLDSGALCTLDKADFDSSLLEKKTTQHDEHEHEKEQHADFEITLKYHCQNADKLTAVNLQGLFRKFPALQEIDVQWLTDQRQSASELDANHPVITLK